MPNSPQTKAFVLKSTALVLLGLLASVYLARGFRILLSPPSDLRARWVEVAYTLSGRNPFDVALAHENATRGLPPPDITRDFRTDPILGVPAYPAYPPWALSMGALFFSTPWQFAARSFAIWNLLALIAMGIWIYRAAPFPKALDRSLPVAIFLAFASLSSTLAAGQYGILIVSFLVGSFYFDERNRPELSGIFLALAMIKPTLSLPFLFPFFFRRKYRTLATCFLILGAASLVTWFLTKTNPWEMLREAFHNGERMFLWGNGWIPLLRGRARLPLSFLIPLVALGVMIPFGIAMRWASDRFPTLLPGFAIAAVAARLWTYHRHYDDLVLIFLFVALLRPLGEKRDSLFSLSFAVVALSLCLPPRHMGIPFQIGQCVIWLAALAVLAGEKRVPQTLDYRGRDRVSISWGREDCTAR